MSLPATPPRNNFDLLRFLFAFTVYLSHTHGLTGEETFAFFSRYETSLLAVKAFFVVSGYLIFKSYEASESLRDYGVKRVRRIYPAYVAMTLLCFAGGAALTTLPISQYFSSGALKFLAANLVFLSTFAPDLPGVFAANPYPAVNGALWTLKIEVLFYASVPAIAWLAARAGRGRTLAVLYACSVIYVLTLGHFARTTGLVFYEQLQRQLPGQLGYFIVGAAGFYSGSLDSKRWASLVTAALLAFAAIAFFPSEPLRAVLEPAALGILVVGAAVALPSLGNFARFGDLSYGIYILHFPLLQVLTSFGAYRSRPWFAFAWATLLLLAAAELCWHFVEKPFLKKSSHYVQAGATMGAR